MFAPIIPSAGISCIATDDLLGGRPLKMMAPSEEGTRRTQFDGDWAVESKRLKGEDGIVCFDLFAARDVGAL